MAAGSKFDLAAKRARSPGAKQQAEAQKQVTFEPNPKIYSPRVLKYRLTGTYRMNHGR